MKLSSLRINTRAEVEGEWIELPVGPAGAVAVKVRGTAYPAFATAAKHTHLRQQLEYLAGAPDEVIVRESGVLCARHLLLDWRGILDDEGEPIPFSPETARVLLTDFAYREFLQLIMFAASRVGRSAGVPAASAAPAVTPDRSDS